MYQIIFDSFHLPCRKLYLNYIEIIASVKITHDLCGFVLHLFVIDNIEVYVLGQQS